MTLEQFFQKMGEQPNFLLAYFLLIPILAIIVGLIGRGEGHLSPWKYIYSILIYLVSVPGIFAVCLNIYFFLFQRGDIMQTNVYFQILPIVSMVSTIFLIRRNVELAYVPGFDKISGLWFMLFVSMFLMWFIEKIHIVVFSYLPFQYLLAVFMGLFILIYVGWRRFVK
jgi:hypothetical protein